GQSMKVSYLLNVKLALFYNLKKQMKDLKLSLLIKKQHKKQLQKRACYRKNSKQRKSEVNSNGINSKNITFMKVRDFCISIYQVCRKVAPSGVNLLDDDKSCSITLRVAR